MSTCVSICTETTQGHGRNFLSSIYDYNKIKKIHLELNYKLSAFLLQFSHLRVTRDRNFFKCIFNFLYKFPISQSFKRSIRFLQVTWVPFNHNVNTFRQQATGPSCLCSFAMRSTLLPSSSKSMRSPIVFHCGALELIICTFPLLVLSIVN